MNFTGLDHVVVNTRDVEQAITFYRDVLGMEILRLEEFRKGEVDFVSARVSLETIIDLRPNNPPDTSEEQAGPNMDHFCLALGPTDMKKLHADLKAQGVRIEETVRPAWGAQGYGEQFKLWDPEGNKIELRCYDAA